MNFLNYSYTNHRKIHFMLKSFVCLLSSLSVSALHEPSHSVSEMNYPGCQHFMNHPSVRNELSRLSALHEPSHSVSEMNYPGCQHFMNHPIPCQKWTIQAVSASWTILFNVRNELSRLSALHEPSHSVSEMNCPGCQRFMSHPIQCQKWTVQAVSTSWTIPFNVRNELYRLSAPHEPSYSMSEMNFLTCKTDTDSSTVQTYMYISKIVIWGRIMHYTRFFWNFPQHKGKRLVFWTTES